MNKLFFGHEKRVRRNKGRDFRPFSAKTLSMVKNQVVLFFFYLYKHRVLVETLVRSRDIKEEVKKARLDFWRLPSLVLMKLSPNPRWPSSLRHFPQIHSTRSWFGIEGWTVRKNSSFLAIFSSRTFSHSIWSLSMSCFFLKRPLKSDFVILSVF